MKRTRNMLAAAAERRAAAWRKRNAHLFADNLADQLAASITAAAVTRAPETPHASDCDTWVGQPCQCITARWPQ
jgi:hypothetical protein